MTIGHGPAGRPGTGASPSATTRRSLGPITITTDGMDVFNQAGVAGLVKHEADIQILPGARIAHADVVVVVAPRLNGKTLNHLRRVQSTYTGRFLLILDELGDGDWVAAAEVGVAGVIWRSTITPRSFTGVVRSIAEGGCVLPTEVQGRLLKDVAHLQNTVLTPRGLTASGLDSREIDMLRLIAEGLGTAEIAQRVQYSERMVKKILYEMMTRLHLRNRSHAVAYAMRSGVF
jgi:DNA-binding NarL/FixJ family response regulator